VIRKVLTPQRKTEELLSDIRIGICLPGGHGITDRRHTSPDELLLVEEQFLDLVQDTLRRAALIKEGLLETV
jgi:hypothetical protein